MKIITSWDDGNVLDLKVAGLLKKYNTPGTFYVVCDWIDQQGYLTWQDVKDLDEAGFEIGSHTMTHPQDLKMVHDDMLLYEVQTSKEMIETVLGHAIKSFCYPRGRYDERVLRMVAEAGYLDARNTIVGDIYEAKDKLETSTSVHVFDARKEYGRSQDWLAYAKTVFKEAQEFDGKEYGETIFHLWGHSWEVDKNKQWERLELFLKYISENIENKGGDIK